MNVGGYMAYENALVAKSDLFYGVGSHMGDFISEGKSISGKRCHYRQSAEQFCDPKR